MAHFARIENNIVQDIHVVANQAIQDSDGVEKEILGQKLLSNLYGFPEHDYVQCSYNGNIRARYPWIGYIYDEDLDVFLLPKPSASWVLDENFDWEAPIPMPDEGEWYWNEDTQTWDAVSEA